MSAADAELTPAPPCLVLFDIDGTLIRTGGAGRRALQEAGRSLFGDGFSVDGLDPSGKLDPDIFEELAARHPAVDLRSRAARFRALYIAALEREAGTLRALPGAAATLAALGSVPGVTLGVLTGNYRSIADLKLRATGLAAADGAPFEIRACGDEAGDRAALVTLAMERYHARFGRALPPARVVLVGDTPRDVAAGRAHGVRVAGVATGRWTAEQLARAGARPVLPDLRDAAPLLALVGGAPL